MYANSYSHFAARPVYMWFYIDITCTTFSEGPPLTVYPTFRLRSTYRIDIVRNAEMMCYLFKSCWCPLTLILYDSDNERFSPKMPFLTKSYV